MPELDAGYYRNLLDSLYDAICCVDDDRKIVYWNKAAESMIGYPESSVLGKVACLQASAFPE